MANRRPVKVVQPSVYARWIAVKLQEVTLADILRTALCLRELGKCAAGFVRKISPGRMAYVN